MITLRAAFLLTADGIRRLLREGIVLRSLVFPVAIALLAVVGTVVAVLFIQAPKRLAITPDQADPVLVAQVREEGFEVLVVDDPEVLVRDRDAALGTDGTSLWIGSGGHAPLVLEEAVRAHLGTVWRPHVVRAERAARIRDNTAPRRLAVFIGALFALYGVVFGAGGVARDKDEGTLDAELTIPVPHVVHGLARWASGSVVLGSFFALSVALLHALMGIPDAWALAAKGAASSAAAVAIGLIVIGRAGLDRGFAGPMSAGLVAVFGILSIGFGARALGAHLPIASLVVRDAPVTGSVLGAVALGLAAAVVFARRTAVT